MMKRLSLFLFLISFLLICGKTLPQSSFGNAVHFDGSGDYAYTLNNPYLPTANGTLEAWIKVSTISFPGGNQGEAFVAKNEEQWNTGDYYAFFDYSNGKLKSRIQAGPSYQFDVVSNNTFWGYQNIWFHYAFTWGSDGMKMYINGVLQSSQNNLSYSALNNSYNIYLGAHGYMLHSGYYVVSDFFDGQIDELRIWNYQKNSQQIISLKEMPLDSTYFATIDSGLVGYWRFDVLEDLGINNDGADDVRDLSVLQNHLDLFGDAHLVSPDPVIPIELSSFFAETINGSIQLSWSTSAEINNLGFEIERCSDKNEWITIGFVDGHGTSTEIQNYNYTDDLFGVNSGIVSYRLKQIDFNGQYNFSSEIVVNVLPAFYNLEQNYPNPFNPSTTIKYSIPNRNYVILVVYDSLGQEVEKLVDGIKEAGSHQINFDGTNIPTGIYFYTLASGNYISTRKMIILK